MIIYEFWLNKDIRFEIEYSYFTRNTIGRNTVESDYKFILVLVVDDSLSCQSCIFTDFDFVR